MNRSTISILTIVIMLSLNLFIVSVSYIYAKNEQSYTQNKTDRMSQAILENLTDEIDVRVRLLKILAHNYAGANDEDFERIADSVLKEYSGFFALNCIGPNGIIKRVFPVESNKEALGKKIIERGDVKDYLLTAKENNVPQMSHMLMTYQNIRAFTLYIPVFGRSGEFIGWLNGVFDFENWLKNYLADHQLNDLSLSIRWEHPSTATVDLIKDSSLTHKVFTRQILNQTIHMEVAYLPDNEDRKKAVANGMIFFVGLFLLIGTNLLLLRLNKIRLRLSDSNSHLSLKNNLISSLTHDISTPLSVLNVNLDIMLSKNQVPTAQQKQRIQRALKIIDEMLKSAKLLHAQGLGIVKVKTQIIDLAQAVNDALYVVSDQAQAKNVEFELSWHQDNVMGAADRSTLINNVLVNVLTNAIKFSPEGGKIKISSKSSSSTTTLVFEDEGVGLTIEQIQRLKQNQGLTSGIGTFGEQGTGLGLLQIGNFMNIYGGYWEMVNGKNAGCCLLLHFKKSE